MSNITLRADSQGAIMLKMGGSLLGIVVFSAPLL